MNRPDRNNFDENDIHKYIILIEQYADKLEGDIDDLEWHNNKLERSKDDLEEDINYLESELESFNKTFIGNGSILDEMTTDWLKQPNNWDFIKSLATQNQLENKIIKYYEADNEFATQLNSLLTSALVGRCINGIDFNEYIAKTINKEKNI
jgi:predicted RNase H-like nuclease (RuvC/YqgF family)